MYGLPLFWRETHKQVRLFIFDGRLSIVFLLMLMHMKWWTFILAVSVTAVMYFFETKGISADSIFRALRASFAGRRRTARGVERERGAVDFGYETQADVDAVKAAIEARNEAHNKRQEVTATRSKGAEKRWFGGNRR